MLINKDISVFEHVLTESFIFRMFLTESFVYSMLLKERISFQYVADRMLHIVKSEGMRGLWKGLDF